MIRRRTLAVTAACLAAGVLPAAHAADYEVTVTNLTSGVHFTPLLLAAHPEGARVFESGRPASEELRAVAEGGDTVALAALLESLGAAVTLDDTLLGPGETRTFTVSDADDPANTRLSIAGMLLPTNDGFVGLDSLKLPRSGMSGPLPPADAETDGDVVEGEGVDADALGDGDGGTGELGPPEEPGTSGPASEMPDEATDETASDTLDPFGEPAPVDEPLDPEAPVEEVPDEMAEDTLSDEPLPIDGIPTVTDDAALTVELLGYDAGTEANDETLGSGAVGEPGFPAPQPVIDSGTGTGASGIAAPIESFVHVHRGVRGDDDPSGGISDVNAAVHGWMNPVARVRVAIVSDVVAE